MELGAREALLKSGVPIDAPDALPPIQVTLLGQLVDTPIREITAAEVNRLLLVPGIVISASRTRPRAVAVTLRCKKCGSERRVLSEGGMSSVAFPRTCPGPGGGADEAGAAGAGALGAAPGDRCPLDPFVVIPDKSR
jgi:DNA replication licensing factor MCM5